MNRKTICAAAALLTLATGPGTATAAMYGRCWEPDAPQYSGMRRPERPACGAGYSRNCLSWEVSEYRVKLDEYTRALRRYVLDVQQFDSQAADFVKCMAETRY